MITRDAVQIKLAAYLNRHISLSDLVDWAENVPLENELDSRDAPILQEIIARLGLADVHQFGLTWEDVSDLIQRLGYSIEVRVVAA